MQGFRPATIFHNLAHSNPVIFSSITFIGGHRGSEPFNMSALLAYDGRPTSEKALDYAIEYSIRFEDPLYILTVVREEQMDPEGPDESVREYMQAAQRKAASSGATVHTIIETGKPDETVIDIADRYDCDTIIVGRSNRSSLDRFLLGSVSDHVAKHASCRVILVPEESDRSRSF